MKAYSEDLRERVVHAVDQGYPRAEIVKMLGVSLATIKRYLKQRRDQGHVKAKAIPGRTPKKLAALQAVAIWGAILLPPGRIGDTAPVAQQIGVPVLATTHTAILRLEPANTALHGAVGARKVLPVVALHQVRAQVGKHL